MKHLPKPEVNYLLLRPNNLNSPDFRHLWYLVFWPVYGIVFLILERFNPVEYYYPMHCALDDLIPFCEWFLIPYLLWFVFLAGAHVYTLFYDRECFKKLMKFLIITYGIATVVYILFPNCQNLRPEEFARDNIGTRFMAWFYTFDTNTNVCPSLHVVGSVAVMLTVFYAKGLGKPWMNWTAVVMTVLISLSTVFLKQHSALDILAAVVVCAVAYPFSFMPKKRKQTE